VTTPPKPGLFPFQRDGVEFLRERTAAGLFDDPGLGKTKQVIEVLNREVEAGALGGAVVICPNTLKTTWSEEIERHSTLRYAVFGAGRKARRDTFRSLRAHFYIINYEAVAAELASLRALLRFKPMALVLDESHRIKTPDAKVTRAVLDLRRDAARRYILTGTPVANKPEDLWSQMYFLDDGSSLGATFDEFRAKYCSAGGGYVRMEELKDRIASITLRRKKEGNVDLPPKNFARVSVSLRGEQKRLYEAMRNELAVWVRSMTGEQVLTEAEGILARMVRLAQLASNPSLLDAGYHETPAKIEALDRLLTEYLNVPDEKLIVWTSFVGNISVLMKRYDQFRPVCLYGEMDGRARDRAIADFKRKKDVRIMVANPAAAREGLTLTVARFAVYLDRTFNLVDFLQSQDRIHRISQHKPCEIVLLIAERTVDEFIEFALAQKHRLAAFVQGDTSQIAPLDLVLQKPDVLRALLEPVGG